MKIPFVSVAACLSVFVTPLSAEPTSQTTGNQSANKNVKNSAKTAKEAVKPLPRQAKDEADRLALKRIAELHKLQADFHKKLKDGKIKTFPQIQENLPAVMKQLGQMDKTYQVFLKNPKSEAGKNAKTALLAALQPIGPFLADATPRKADLTITKEQAARISELSKKKFPKLDPKDSVSLKLISPDSVYTLLDLPVDIVVKTKPNTLVYLAAEAGGVFSDKTNLKMIKADENGFVRESWISRGDSVGHAEVLVYSPQSSTREVLTIFTKQLKLRPLASATPAKLSK